MPTESTNVLPESTGLDLGSSSQRWDLFAQNADFSGSISGIASLTGLTQLTTKQLNNIRFASQFTGADWGAKVNAASTDLGSARGEIWLDTAAGTSACAADVALGAGHILRVVQAGTYSLGTFSFKLGNFSGIVTPYAHPTGTSTASVQFTHTGTTGTAIAPTSTASLTRDVILKGFRIYGPDTGSTVGIDLHNCSYWVVEDVQTLGFDTAIRIYGSALGVFFNQFHRVHTESSFALSLLIDADSSTNRPNRQLFSNCNFSNGSVNAIRMTLGNTQCFVNCKINGHPGNLIECSTVDNQFYGMNLEGTGAGTGLLLNPGSDENLFMGTIASVGTLITDNGANNTWFELNGGTTQFGWPVTPAASGLDFGSTTKRWDLFGATLNVGTGIAQAGGIKHERITTGSIAAAGSAAVTLTWATAFADANYTPQVSVIESQASTSSLRVHHIESVTAAAVVVRVVNDDGGNARTGTLQVTAVHDG